ncbi:MAG: CDP-diacylglycerol--glycerol-3-phosphate 3-phosphatidyltransferase [Acholeplasmatales bacterium]|jgi:CDP-diacylglycerol--glycerol-3-phosphate 3-phosphatidyltransferase|nr:CDP-diacylglycerol--glycerol-3-phosphate 3-phosphatidyltransferase [Acholeplasmatales bacterium]
MTTPNKITIFRIILVPIIIIIAYIPFLNNYYLTGFFNLSLAQLINAIIFVIGSLSDFLDGFLARKNHQVTTFGKFLDPIADKLLTIAALLYLVKLGYVEVWIVLVILLREFIVSGIRLVVANKNIVIAASIFGKLKTTMTMITIIFIMFNEFGLGAYTMQGVLPFVGNVGIVSIVLLFLTVILTLQSGIDYFIKTKDHLFESM